MHHRSMRGGLLILGGACLVACGPASADETMVDSEVTLSEEVGAKVEFEDRFSASGRFLVVRDDSGNLGVAVVDAIGATSVTATFGEHSLGDIYLALHPADGMVPENLARLVDEFEVQRRPPVAASAVEPDHEGSMYVRSLTTFNATVCRNISESSTLWVKHGCQYKANNYLVQVCGYQTGNRSYAWNETPHVGSHQLLPCSSWQPSVPAWSYMWTQWGGACEFGCARFVTSAVNPGNLGVTVHRPTPIVK